VEYPWITEQADGKLRLEGSIVEQGEMSDMNWVGSYLAQYTTTGQLDATFGVGGVLTAPAGGTIQNWQTATDGSIYASMTQRDEISFIRFSKDGKIDMTFAGDTVGDTLIGNDGNDTLVSGVAVSSLVGGAGDDVYYVNNALTVVVDTSGESDEIIASTSYDLSKNNSIEKLTFANGIGGANLVGNSLNNTITGDAAKDTINGGIGADAMVGGDGNDLYIVDNGGDTIEELEDEGIDTVNTLINNYTLSENLENLVLLAGVGILSGTGNTANNRLVGNSLANTLFGLGGDDTLDGGAGNDSLIGGEGNDYYIVDAVGDRVLESDGEGTDTVESRLAANYTLGVGIENLVLGSGGSSGTGNAENNILIGNSVANTLRGLDGNDTLDGGAGVDSLIGGSGDDYYIIDNIGDRVFETADQGIDTVEARVTGYTLANGVENLILFGAVAAGTGNSLDNSLLGNSVANTLNGGIGADFLAGGEGNDLYIVDNAGDTIEEIEDEGIDTVNTLINNYTLSENLENLVLLAGVGILSGAGNTANNRLVGNSLANTLFGLGGDDTLDGGAGNDSLIGGEGNDYYIVDAVGDRVLESDGEGTDTVESRLAANYTLGVGIENLVLGSGGSSGTGNAENNILIGNSVANTLRGLDGNDTLDGGAGVDSLIGGSGDDYYIIDNIGDRVFETADQGIDTVEARVTGYTLANGVENLILFGAVAAGTGNSLDNVLTGNLASNSLNGGAGSDTLTAAGSNNGRGQRDTLTGGAGVDSFILGNESGAFYDDGNASNAGAGDYAYITDFTAGQDVLVLSGSASDYFVKASGISGLTGTFGIFKGTGAATDELISVLKASNTTAQTAIDTAQFINLPV
jgi:Ca2+-binding RTX toxin-like protein